MVYVLQETQLPCIQYISSRALLWVTHVCSSVQQSIKGLPVYKQLVPDDFMRAVGGQYFKDLHLDEVYNTTP